MNKIYATYSESKVVACEAPINKATEQKILNGVRVNARRSGLVGLKVAFAHRTIPVDATIYVQATLLENQKWATEPVEFEGKQIVFVPENFILLVGTDAL